MTDNDVHATQSPEVASVEALEEQITTRVRDDLKIWIKKGMGFIFGGFSVLTIIALYQIYVSVTETVTETAAEYISDSIATRFSEPRIQDTLNDVAKNQAAEIIERTLNPEISKATKMITERSALFRSDIDALQHQFDSQLNALQDEVTYIQERNQLFKLGDTAIATADANAFDDLFKVLEDSDSSDEKKILALAEIFRVKGHFANMSRIKGFAPVWTDPLTKKKIAIEKSPTEIILNGFSDEKSWKLRAKCAQALKTRKEKGVPEALLNAVRSDPNLEVRKDALNSFERVTGFKSFDVFAYKPAESWWNEHKDEVNAELDDLQTVDLYYLGPE